VRASSDLDALGKIFLGRTEHQAVRLATLNPPATIDLPIEEIHALHRVDGGIDVERLAPEELGSLAYVAQFNTGQPIEPINPEWRPARCCVGLSAFTGEMMSRYASRDRVGSALGPTVELGGTLMFRSPGAALSDEGWAASDTRALRKILPLQNVFYLRRLFDQVEHGVNDLLGVKEKKSSWPL